MNEFEYYRDIQLSGGTLLAVAVTGETDATITTPGSQEEFFNQVQLDEQGRLKIYIRDYISPTPTPTPTPTPVPFSTQWLITTQSYPTCSFTGSTTTVYTSENGLGTGLQVCTDPFLNNPFVGDPSKYYTFSDGTNVWGVLKIGTDGWPTSLEQNCIPYSYVLSGNYNDKADACSLADQNLTFYTYGSPLSIGDVLYQVQANSIAPIFSNLVFDYWLKYYTDSTAILVEGQNGEIIDIQPC